MKMNIFRMVGHMSHRNFTTRRALLYVPADDMKKVQKSFTLNADCIMLDCEDGVASNKKEQARLNIRQVLDKGKPITQRNYDLGVRINSFSSGLTEEDLKVVVAGHNLPDSVFLPKIEDLNELKMFSDLLNATVKTEGTIELIMGIESAKSLIKVDKICEVAEDLSKASKFKPAALLFGSDDFCASIGARRSESAVEILYARQKLVAVAKAFNLQAIDMVYIDYKNSEGLKRQSEEGAKFGFTGKQIIHPGQIEITQNAFLPTQQELEWANSVIKAFETHQKEGKGAFTFKNQMIDMPTIKQAYNILELIIK